MSDTDVLIHSDHLIGIGHYVRIRALVCAALRSGLRITWCLGSNYPSLLPPPAEVALCPMPPLYEGGVPHSDAAESKRRRERRIELLARLIQHTRPRLLVTETFPFGRFSLLPEVVGLLQAARAMSPRPLCVCSLRDIPALPAEREQLRERLRDIDALLAEFYDAITWHADPTLISLEQALGGLEPPVPLFPTGYVEAIAEPSIAAAGEPLEFEEGTIVASAGSGVVGYPLLSTLLEAATAGNLSQRKLLIIAGPRMPEQAARALESRAARLPAARLLRSVAELRPLLARAAVSVSQAGYNTCLDVLTTRSPMVLVPVERSGDQPARAELLSNSGRAVVLKEKELSSASLADAIERALQKPPVALDVLREGAFVTAARWADWVQRGTVL